MTRYLFVISCNDPSRLEFVQQRVGDNKDVEVILDRRYRDRRRREDRPVAERRSSERRRDYIDAALNDLGWVMVTRH